MKISQVGERGLVALLQKGALFSPASVVKGIGDDAAVLSPPPGKLLLASGDLLVEGVHFLREKTTPWQLGYKALAVNLSDIAAMGGVPTQVLLSLGLPWETEVNFVEEFTAGLKACAAEFQLNLVGGDLVAAPLLVVSITVLGEVEAELFCLRSGAKPGDFLLVTGDLGASAVGLDTLLLPGGYPPAAVQYVQRKHLLPAPRVKEGRLLARSKQVTALIDLSDGLAGGLQDLRAASKVGALIFAEKIPVAGATQEIASFLGKDALGYALYGGEDYELLFTAGPGEAEELIKLLSTEGGVKATIIGEILPFGEGIKIHRGTSLEFLAEGYDHFLRKDFPK